MKRNTLEQMADIIAAVKAGEIVEVRGKSTGWVSVMPTDFLGNFFECEYRRIREPEEVWLLKTAWGWTEVAKGFLDSKLFREVRDAV